MGSRKGRAPAASSMASRAPGETKASMFSCKMLTTVVADEKIVAVEPDSERVSDRKA